MLVTFCTRMYFLFINKYCYEVLGQDIRRFEGSRHQKFVIEMYLVTNAFLSVWWLIRQGVSPPSQVLDAGETRSTLESKTLKLRRISGHLRFVDGIVSCVGIPIFPFLSQKARTLEIRIRTPFGPASTGDRWPYLSPQLTSTVRRTTSLPRERKLETNSIPTHFASEV